MNYKSSRLLDPLIAGIQQLYRQEPNAWTYVLGHVPDDQLIEFFKAHPGKGYVVDVARLCPYSTEQFMEFFCAYVEVALWSELDEDGEPLDDHYCFEDMDPSTRARMHADCAAFLTNHFQLLCRATYPEAEYTSWQMAGHDFWLTRNGHGTGFWDRGLGEVGEELTRAAQAWGEAHLYVTDDNKVRHL